MEQGSIWQVSQGLDWISAQITENFLLRDYLKILRKLGTKINWTAESWLIWIGFSLLLSSQLPSHPHS
jgi:hypothetical protein